MALHKGTLLLNDRNAGWSESWYRETVETMDQSLTSLILLADSRNRLLGAGGPHVDYVRVSDEAVRGDASVRAFPPTWSKPYDVNLLCAIVQKSLLLRISNTNLYRRMFHLRGIPDDMAVQGRWVDDNGYEQAVKGFFTLMRNQGWGIRCIDKDVTNPEKAITAANQVGGIWTITANGHGIQNGEKATIRGMKGTSVPNGVHTITAVAANTFETVGLFPVGTYVGGGFVRRHVYKTRLPEKVDIVRAAKRDTGRCFFSPVGRR